MRNGLWSYGRARLTSWRRLPNFEKVADLGLVTFALAWIIGLVVPVFLGAAATYVAFAGVILLAWYQVMYRRWCRKHQK